MHIFMNIFGNRSILGGNELNTVGPSTENARRVNSVRTRGTNNRGAPAERIGLAGAVKENKVSKNGDRLTVQHLLYFKNIMHLIAKDIKIPPCN